MLADRLKGRCFRVKILMIAIDTLRADRLGCYGYNKPNMTPHIDQLAKDGVLFERCIAENNVTQSSFVTMMTGKSPYQHGIVNMKPTTIPSRLIPLSQILRKNGYRTAAVDCNTRITGKFNPWFKRGYQTYIDPAGQGKTHLTVPAHEINRHALGWLQNHRQEKDWFLFVHYWDPHFPYLPQPSFTRMHVHSPRQLQQAPGLNTVLREPLWSFIRRWSKDINNPQHINELYDAAVSQADDAVGQLVSHLRDWGIWENTLVILVSDHGESLGEHRIYYDHHGLYEPTIHVPLILSCPTKLPAQRRIPDLVQHADILPTILDIAGIPIPRHIQPLDGFSMVPTIEGKAKNVRPYAISCEANWQLKRCIRTPYWKLIQSLEPDVYGNPRFELYNLKLDPKETKNLIQRAPKVAKRLHANMARWIRLKLTKYKRKDPLSRGVKVRLHRQTAAEEEKVKKRLSELGY